MLLEERVKLSELMWPHGKHHSSSPSGTGSIPTKSKLFSAGLVKKFNQKGYWIEKNAEPKQMNKIDRLSLTPTSPKWAKR